MKMFESRTWNPAFNQYIGDFSKYQDLSNIDKISQNYVKVIDADIGRNVSFNRIAIHHITLLPCHRTSLPHAESLEEEFIFVIRGTPHLWLNGYIYGLKEGYAIGLPAGTGIAHTFINNSNSNVELLVVGERTKKENLCAFPVNPELKNSSPIWWESYPKFKLGPHNGHPGPIKENEWGGSNPSCVVFCPSSERSKQFCYYPGDNEIFGGGVCITDLVWA